MALNALGPFAAQIFTRVLMLGYAVVQYRLIGGGANALGDYFLAGIVLMYTGTISDWGLGTLLPREVAKRIGGEGSESKDQESGAREQRPVSNSESELFRQTLVLRLLISITLFVPVGVFVLVYVRWFGLSMAGAWVTLLLTLSLVPGAYSGSVTALLYARERMSLPAAVGVATSMLNVGLGVAALLLGWGVVGLALAALASSVATAGAFFGIMQYGLRIANSAVTGLGAVSPAKSKILDKAKALELLRDGWPLMLNALLVGLFFRADQFIIKARLSTLDVERYAAAYSFLSFVLLITPAVTLALFPRMARHAEADRARLAYEYYFALKVLVLLSVPLVALTVWLAPLLITIVTGGKSEYLPQSAIALQILILFLPLSFVNGVTQYVLIALNLQKLITRAFGATVVFNIGSNMLLVPAMGINGAAVTTVASEIVLLVPFLYWTSRELGVVDIVGVTWRAGAGAAAVGAVGWLLRSTLESWPTGGPELAAYLGTGVLLVAVYAGVVAALRPFSEGEVAGLRRALRRERPASYES
ncbi:MAG TPA: polysaccharide biosynthesis C-terminal domain-containing protein [Chloroflexia bacterium]|nr:polysaccharide biosynthesis C-terminal domain-containing protein [Chloroflexia bacterium]